MNEKILHQLMCATVKTDSAIENVPVLVTIYGTSLTKNVKWQNRLKFVREKERAC